MRFVLIESILDGAVHYGGLMLMHGTVLALITWLLSLTIFRRNRPSIQAALWIIVLIKFMLPPILPGEMALSGWITKAASAVAVSRHVNLETSPDLKEPAPSIIRQQPESVERRWNSISPLLVAGYLFFVILLGARALIAHRRNRRRIFRLPVAGLATQSEVGALADLIGLKRSPQVKSTDSEMTPYVFGCRRPVLVLPERLMRILEPTERRALILHELAHIHRRDILVRGLQGLTGIFFFFFPPVLWVSRRVEYFTELACDSWAVTLSEVAPSAYANALVKVVKEIGRVSQPQPGLAFIRSTRLLEARLRAVLRDDAGKSPRLSTGGKTVLASWSLFVLMGGATAASPRIATSIQESLASKAEPKSSPEVTVKEPTRGMAKRVDPTGTVSSSDREPSQSKSAPGRALIEQREIPLATETRAIEGGVTEVASSSSIKKTLTPYEEGYRLGAQYAREQSSRSWPNESTSPVRQPSGQESKRGIELRMQGLARPPVNQ
jgi:beta-lactamase regulating signal transducer with metallopeptidase domain